MEQACPLCRAKLPASVEGLYELAWRISVRSEGMVARGEESWGPRAAEQEEMEEAVHVSNPTVLAEKA